MMTLSEIAIAYPELFLTMHLFAMVLGLGGATYSDILLVRFLSDFKISKKEMEVIKTMAQVILIGILLAFLSGIMLFLPDMDRLLNTPKFLVKCVIFGIVVVNGFVLHHLILPRLMHFCFHKDVCVVGNVNLRHAGFVSGAISVVSWYSIFFLGSFKNVPFTFWQLLGAYLFVLFGAVLIALLVEHNIKKLARSKR